MPILRWQRHGGNASPLLGDISHGLGVMGNPSSPRRWSAQSSVRHMGDLPCDLGEISCHLGAPPTLTGAPPSHLGAPPCHAGPPPSRPGPPPCQPGAPPFHLGAPPNRAGEPPSRLGSPPFRAGEPPKRGEGILPSSPSPPQTGKRAFTWGNSLPLQPCKRPAIPRPSGLGGRMPPPHRLPHFHHEIPHLGLRRSHHWTALDLR